MLLAVVPFSASAEVMDKELPLFYIVGVAIFLSIGGFFMSRRTKWGLPASLILTTAALLPVLTELADPFVGPDIFREAGWIYAACAYATIPLVLASCLCGMLVGKSRNTNLIG
ncbi:MAG: hypothetical protein JNN20_17470 [Betaproteobacteria bacterium]|nr:hypothetical protein [Betaproteobacteria bacterium]